MQKPIQRTFVIHRILSESTSRRGDPYVECQTDDGVIAFWGGRRNISNISRVKELLPPFSITCGYIAPSRSFAERHSFWVPQSPEIPRPTPWVADQPAQTAAPSSSQQ